MPLMPEYMPVSRISDKLAKSTSVTAFSKVLREAWKAGVLEAEVTPRRAGTWAELMGQQEFRTRYPH